MKISDFVVFLIFGGVLVIASVLGQLDRKVDEIHAFLANAQIINVVSTNSVEVVE